MHLFTPASASRGLVILAPGGGQDQTSPGVVARATNLTDRGYAVAVIRSLDQVPAVLAKNPGPVGFWGISQGARVGLPLLAAEPRITAAVLGLMDGPIISAPLVTAPVLFYIQSDDDLVQPDGCRALFGALGSADKTLVENPGGHLDLPRASVEESAAWLDRKLTEQARVEQGSSPVRLRCGIVLRVHEAVCEVLAQDRVVSVGYAPMLPSPRTERVSPGHLVAVATLADGTEAVVWRWYDAVVLGEEAGLVRLWEPAHGEVVAQPRIPQQPVRPGTRAYLSAGLPGADWWVAGTAAARAESAEVELDEVARFYTGNDLWNRLV